MTDSDAFLDMPLSSQALYFHLNMNADDDGFVNNPKKVQRIIGASEDDLKLLIMKRFLIGFEGGVIVIKHWRMHNTLKSDRYKPTQYQEELAMLDVKDNKSYTERTTPRALPETRVPAISAGGNTRRAEVSPPYEGDTIPVAEAGRGTDMASVESPAAEEAEFPPVLQAAFDDWLAYKRERREAYKPTGLRNLKGQIRTQAEIHGAEAVAELIRLCMASNWRGIIFDRLRDKAPQGCKPKTNVIVPRESPEEEYERMKRMFAHVAGGQK